MRIMKEPMFPAYSGEPSSLMSPSAVAVTMSLLSASTL